MTPNAIAFAAVTWRLTTVCHHTILGRNGNW